jgi:hypothetical protein
LPTPISAFLPQRSMRNWGTPARGPHHRIGIHERITSLLRLPAFPAARSRQRHRRPHRRHLPHRGCRPVGQGPRRQCQLASQLRAQRLAVHPGLGAAQVHAGRSGRQRAADRPSRGRVRKDCLGRQPVPLRCADDDCAHRFRLALGGPRRQLGGLRGRRPGPTVRQPPRGYRLAALQRPAADIGLGSQRPHRADDDLDRRPAHRGSGFLRSDRALPLQQRPAVGGRRCPRQDLALWLHPRPAQPADRPAGPPHHSELERHRPHPHPDRPGWRGGALRL